jgi:hypothetical protein
MLTMKEFHYEVIQPVRSPIFGFGVEKISQIRAPLKNHQIALAQKKRSSSWVSAISFGDWMELIKLYTERPLSEKKSAPFNVFLKGSCRVTSSTLSDPFF